MIQSISFVVMEEHFAPVSNFRIIMTKVPHLNFLAKMFIFVLASINLIMSKVRRKIIFDYSSYRLMCCK